MPFIMIRKDFNPVQFMTNLRVIYLALVSGIVIFLAVVINIIGSDNIKAMENIDVLFMADLVITAVMLPGAYLISNRKFEQINKEDPLESKLSQFQAAYILRLAMFEAPALLSVIVLMLTGYMGTLALFTVSLALIALNYPTADRIARILDLSDSDKSKLEQ